MTCSTRRKFLQTTALAAAAFAIPNVFTFAQTNPTEPTLRWGIIGTGHRGCVAHIPAINSFPEMQFLGACDVMDNHLQQGVKKIGKPVQSYTDYQKLLANLDINAVMIATPNCLHHEMVLAALQANKHVICEKPMAVNFQQCKAMKAAAEKSDRTVLYSMQLRYSPRWKLLRDTIESGKIGKPKHLLFVEYRGDWNRGDVWKFNDPKQGPVNWRFSHAASGGTLNEKVCHYFDILSWMIGEIPASVSCTGGIAKYADGRDTWDHATTTITYPSGCVATHDLCMFGPKRLDLHVIGEEGSIRASEESDALIVQSKSNREELKPQPEIAHGKGQETAVLLMYKDFLGCVTNNKKPSMDADKAMASSKTAWLAELSNQNKRQVTWEELT